MGTISQRVQRPEFPIPFYDVEIVEIAEQTERSDGALRYGYHECDSARRDNLRKQWAWGTSGEQ